MDDKNLFKRRTALKAVATGIGLSSGTTFVSNPVIGEASSDEVKIVTIREGDTVRETTSVPRKWYEHVRTARRVRQQLGERYKTTEEIKALSRASSTDNRIQDYSRTHVRVYVGDIDAIDVEIPNQVDDIDVRVLQYHEGELDNCNEYTVDPLPGGISGGGDDNDSDCYGKATWGCRLEDPDSSDHFMVHCAHTFDICGDTVYGAYNECNKVGQLKSYSATRDTAIVEPTSDYDMDVDGYDDWIEGESWGPISGRVTENGLDELKSSSKLPRPEGRGIQRGLPF